MKTVTPDYYNKFKCTASKCNDNCCIGWEIDIDESSLNFYQAQNSDFGKRLKSSISSEETPHFILDKDERCPFLNKQNLCDIILNLGEEKICEICTKHPRFYEWYNDQTEIGLGLCCEEACRLILQNEFPVSFICSEDYNNKNENNTDVLALSSLIKARNTLFKIIQNRKHSIKNRISKALVFCTDLQAMLDKGDFKGIATFSEEYSKKEVHYFRFEYENNLTEKNISKLIDIFLSLEINSQKWRDDLIKIKTNLSQIIKSLEDFDKINSRLDYQYEQLIVYFVYRYFLKSAFDHDLLSKIHFAICGYVIVRLLDIEGFVRNQFFSDFDRIINAKDFSKEIEYCEENIEALQNESIENEIFSEKNIFSLII